MGKENFKSLLQKEGIDGSGFKTLLPPYKKNELYLAFSKVIENSMTWSKDFNEGLSEIRADGTYDKIIAAYGF